MNWAIYEPERLCDRVRLLLEDTANEFIFSYASVWELLNKVGRGRLLVAGISVASVFNDIEAFSVTLLPVSLDHILSAASLPHFHSDPFDRMFVAQALAEGVPLVTVDPEIQQYPIQTIWASAIPLRRSHPLAISYKPVPLTATTPAVHSHTRSTLLADYATLFKLRVSTMVVITAGAGFYLGSLRSGISPFNIGLVEALLGIAVVTAGSAALNQALERNTDSLMPRTAARPMAQRRISLAHGLIVGFLAVFGGSLYLAWVTNPLTGMLTLLTAVGYVAIYTPLKRFTTINTFIGAFPGALPPLLGWTAVRGVIEWPAVALFAILFVWQFPHFMAIGWLYRSDYAAGGIRVTSTQPDIRDAARSTVIQSLFYAVLMVPTSLWLTWLHVTGLPYAIAATLLGLWYLYATIRFARILRNPAAPENRLLARTLLKVSVMYLPLLMLAMILNAQGRLLIRP